MGKLRVGVIFGGRSGEHEISLLSATSVIAAMDRDRYDVVPIGISKEGRWLRGDDTLSALSEGNIEHLRPTLLLTDPQARGLAPLPTAATAAQDPALERLDVVFPVLHGTFGEDGTIQGLLELAGIPYVGCGVAASAVGMDKALMKAVFASAGLPQVRHVVALRTDIEAAPAAVEASIARALPLPVFVKPCNMGSSVGVSKVKAWVELGDALRDAARYDRRVLVEEGVEGAREIEVAVLGNDAPEASVAGEIVPGAEFYDYRAKYLDDTSTLHIPAKLPPAAAALVRDLALRAFRAVDGAGMARVDFFYLEASGRILVNEINTIPGFTKISMYPKLWEATGLSYAALVDRLIELAIERHDDRARSSTSFAGKAAGPST